MIERLNNINTLLVDLHVGNKTQNELAVSILKTSNSITSLVKDNNTTIMMVPSNLANYKHFIYWRSLNATR
jgi:hypothetical protein